MSVGGGDWSVTAYEAFSDQRLRPALDLLGRVFPSMEGDVVDLGCGSGAAAPALRARFPSAHLIGFDGSADMLAKAEARGVYDALAEGDIADWGPDRPPAVIYSNAALHWLDDHAALIPRLFGSLAEGGALAVQMPGQLLRPSHQTMLAAARAVRPDLFEGWTPFPGPLPLADYAEFLPDAEIDLWSTEYLQKLTAAEGHPVRAFTGSTGARPIYSKLDMVETEAFDAAWDDALAAAYPQAPDGSVWMPFLRHFFVARRPLKHRALTLNRGFRLASSCDSPFPGGSRHASSALIRPSPPVPALH